MPSDGSSFAFGPHARTAARNTPSSGRSGRPHREHIGVLPVQAACAHAVLDIGPERPSAAETVAIDDAVDRGAKEVHVPAWAPSVVIIRTFGAHAPESMPSARGRGRPNGYNSSLRNRI